MPADPLLSYRHHQVALLARLSEEGRLSDESLAAEVGCDRSAVTRWRQGSRAAPLALLWVILAHLRPDERVEVLDAVGRPFGVRAMLGEGIAVASFEESLNQLRMCCIRTFAVLFAGEQSWSASRLRALLRACRLLHAAALAVEGAVEWKLGKIGVSSAKQASPAKSLELFKKGAAS